MASTGCGSVRLWKLNILRHPVRQKLTLIKVQSFNNQSQNVPMPDPNLHYGAIFQPAIPGMFYATMHNVYKKVYTITLLLGNMKMVRNG